jgi:hypothetical protein
MPAAPAREPAIRLAVAETTDLCDRVGMTAALRAAG